MPIGQRNSDMDRSLAVCLDNERGFSLVEVLIALAAAIFGLLAAGQLLFMAMSSLSLANSKGTAALTAMNTLESLSDLYSRNPLHEDFAPGNHGPQEIKVMNPNDGNVLNRFSVTWTSGIVRDPRPGKTPDARLIQVTVTPIRSDGTVNYRPPYNKILSITTIFSRRMP